MPIASISHADKRTLGKKVGNCLLQGHGRKRYRRQQEGHARGSGCRSGL